jgi:Ring finger domain
MTTDHPLPTINDLVFSITFLAVVIGICYYLCIFINKLIREIVMIATRPPVQVARQPPIVFEEEECSICLGALRPRGKAILNCGHMFHFGCLHRALMHHNNCPLCNAVVRE